MERPDPIFFGPAEQCEQAHLVRKNAVYAASALSSVIDAQFNSKESSLKGSAHFNPLFNPIFFS